MIASAGALALGAAALVAFAADQRPDFTAGGQPMTQEQIVQKMQSEGYSNVQVQRQGANLLISGQKNGKTENMTVNAQTGKAVAEDDEDDD
ncbi:hypothetical protein SLNSH_06210 [Alsobacter soli]|uniref:PepSY domain-containing protein n=1 Tax=Alsobacter soli TaxID=2109933 RepID=A0A2T1HW99_9HYPH|nr:hypothetical protein SLNSH_06210 [Alsobacter soli]